MFLERAQITCLALNFGRPKSGGTRRGVQEMLILVECDEIPPDLPGLACESD
jgi:hypothetical protein